MTPNNKHFPTSLTTLHGDHVFSQGNYTLFEDAIGNTHETVTHGVVKNNVEYNKFENVTIIKEHDCVFSIIDLELSFRKSGSLS